MTDADRIREFLKDGDFNDCAFAYELEALAYDLVARVEALHKTVDTCYELMEVLAAGEKVLPPIGEALKLLDNTKSLLEIADGLE